MAQNYELKTLNIKKYRLLDYSHPLKVQNYIDQNRILNQKI